MIRCYLPSDRWDAALPELDEAESRHLAGVMRVRAGERIGLLDGRGTLGEAEVVGAVDDQGVGRGDVNPRLDDRGGDQAVGVTPEEVQHRRLELLILHLAVGDLDPDPGHQRPEALGGLVE